MFLNNRYHDPTAQFISVDPLVNVTGEPYIYGSANPITLSDPSGLCPYAGCWEAFDAYLRGLREAASHVQDETEVSPGEPLPGFRVQRHAEKQAAWSLDFNDPIGIGGVPVHSRLAPRPEVEPYRQAEDCAGPFCAAWEHRRGLLLGASVAAGGVCIVVTAGTCSVVVASVAAANVAQSVQDNLSDCTQQVVIDAALNATPIIAGRAAGRAIAEGAGKLVEGIGLTTGSGFSQINVCADYG